MKRPAKRSPFTLTGSGSSPEAEAAAIEQQRAWAHAVASAIERGDLPAHAAERCVVASILRHWADQLQPAKRSRRGNPKFKRKLPEDDQPALLVAFRIAEGVDEAEAIRQVADLWEVDPSTVAKIFRARRKAIADSLLIARSNLAHRAGAIRGE